MVFSSLTFLLVFLPVVLVLYYTVPGRLKNAVLFVCSLWFYAWGEPIYVCLMVFSTVLDFSCGRYVERYRGTKRAKYGLAVSVIVNLGLLCFFKYSGFVINTINQCFGASLPTHELPLPIGISFYTFQTMSYTIDVYRNDIKAQKNIISFGAYVTLFPQLIAGPIVRYSTIAEQIDKRTHSFDSFGDGVRRFVCGLGKKVLLANNIGQLWESAYSMSAGDTSVLMAWLGIIAYTFQIYFDFSGYSDMAIGLGKMFGFSFPGNFNYPYISRSVTEFWRRWHISLGSWFRDYVYIPLGGNRKGRIKWLRNIGIVWLLTGLWHGAGWNFILWGVLYGVLLAMEKLFLLDKLNRAPKVISWLYTAVVVIVGWVLFAFDKIGYSIGFFGTLVGVGAPLADTKALFALISYLPLFLICAVAATPLGHIAYERMCGQKLIDKRISERIMCASELAGMTVIVVLVVSCLISGSYNPFLYFRF